VTWSAHITRADYDTLHRHLFRRDRDEHAAFLICGITRAGGNDRLLVRSVQLVDDADFGFSDRGGYRQIAPRAIARAARAAGDDDLCIVWVHSHPGSGDSVGLSGQDHDTHALAEPALSDITNGKPVGALVLGERSAAGILTFRTPSGTSTEKIAGMRIIGSTITEVTESPNRNASSLARFARQIHLFGAAGQARLRGLTVAVVGAGGGGSLLIQMLAHLGVGRIIVVDFDVVETSNLSRIVGSTPGDAIDRVLKMAVAKRLVAAIDPDIEVVGIDGDITYEVDAQTILEADFIFLATDTILARWAFNLICHQYLIPGIQVGAKVTNIGDEVATVHVMTRTVAFAGGCLDCMGVIPADALADEQLTDDERKAQRYIDTGDDEQVVDPSVITLNSVAASLAMTDFLFMFTGLHRASVTMDQLVYHPLERSLRHRDALRRPGCPTCDPNTLSSFARGDSWPLQLRAGARGDRARQADVTVGSVGWLRRAWAWLRSRVARA
jgi:molybdopterin/thiamine biosynthesis adenylyltransferase